VKTIQAREEECVRNKIRDKLWVNRVKSHLYSFKVRGKKMLFIVLTVATKCSAVQQADILFETNHNGTRRTVPMVMVMALP
jgi:hypothetical protein